MSSTAAQYTRELMVLVMMFNVTFNNISVISWRSYLLVKKTRVPGDNHRPAASHFITLCYTDLAMSRIRTHNFGGGRH